MTIQDVKIKAVLDWSCPLNKQQVQQFLGFVNYHRAFISDFANIAIPLYKLTGKEEFIWGDDQQVAFETLKMAVVSAPVLAYPSSDVEDTFILDTDASHGAIGAQLSQMQSGVERVIAYASQTLTPSQKNYCTTRKELLAVVVFTRQFRHYLLGRGFIVRTDHNSLVWLMSFKESHDQLSRWQEELMQYDMKIIHRPGRLHQNADSLSRIPSDVEPCPCYFAGSNLSQLPCGGCPYCTKCHVQWRRFEEDIDDVIPLAVRVIDLDSVPKDDEEDHQVSNWINLMSSTDIRKHQLEDPVVRPLIGWLETGKDPENHELWLTSAATKHFWGCKNQLQLEDGVLYYDWVDGPFQRLKLVVPQGLKAEVLKFGHDARYAGHPGQKKTTLRIKRSFIWYGMAQEIQLYVATCAACNKNKKATVKPKAAMECYHAGVPMERVHLDLLGPLIPSTRGNRYILVMVDQFTKWLECHPLPEQSAEQVARTAVHEFFCRMGCPLQAHSDQGTQFTGSIFTQLCELLEIAKTRTTPYRPSANGQVERYNRDLLKSIRCFLEGRQNCWDEYLPLLAMAIRCTENRTTGFSANMMMLGREIVTPLELVTGVSVSNSNPLPPVEHVQKLTRRLQEIHEFAREKVGHAQKYQKRTHDLKLQQRPFSVGDLVYKLDSASSPGMSRKLKPVYVGPLVVSEVISPLLYRVEGRRRSQVLHHDRLRFCNDRAIPMWARRKRHVILNLDSTLPYEHDEPVPAPGASIEDAKTLDLAPLFSEASLPASFTDSGYSLDATMTADSIPPTTDQGDDVQDDHVPEMVEIAPRVSKRGRVIRKPSYLDEYVQ
jgi:transposase InsO family protein